MVKIFLFRFDFSYEPTDCIFTEWRINNKVKIKFEGNPKYVAYFISVGVAAFSWVYTLL